MDNSFIDLLPVGTGVIPPSVSTDCAPAALTTGGAAVGASAGEKSVGRYRLHQLRQIYIDTCHQWSSSKSTVPTSHGATQEDEWRTKCFHHWHFLRGSDTHSTFTHALSKWYVLIAVKAYFSWASMVSHQVSFPRLIFQLANLLIKEFHWILQVLQIYWVEYNRYSN